MLKAVLSKVTTVLISDSTVFKGFYIVRVGIIVENRRLHKLAPSVRPFCPKNGPLVRSMSVMAIYRQGRECSRLLRSAPIMRRITKRIVPLLICVMSFLAGCSQKTTQKNICPIDGQPPQWSGAKNGRSCEYSHYSVVEKKTHSWWADCQPDAAE